MGRIKTGGGALVGQGSRVPAISGQMRRLLGVDVALLHRIRRLERPAVTRLMGDLTRLGNASTWTLLGALLFASGGGARRHAWLLTVAALVATLLAQALKRTCRRSRPSHGICGFVALADNPDVFSFPSGHATVAAAVAIALAGEGAALGAMMAAVAAGVGVSRVYLGAHYPLDVAAGGLVGALAGICARALVL